MNNSTNNTSVDEMVKAYFDDLHLDDAKMQHLVSMHQAPAPQTDRPQRPRRGFLLAASLSGAFIAAGAGYAVYQWNDGRHQSRLSTDVQLITELVTNHHDQVPLDVTSMSIETVALTLSDRAFDLRLPEKLLAQASIVGARYCSLLGEPAIQFRLKDKASRRDITAFVTLASETLQRFDGVATSTENLSISANRLDNLLIAIVAEI